MSGPGRIFVVHVPKDVLLDALSNIVPPGFSTVVFSQWSEDRDAMMIGFTEGEESVVLAPLGGGGEPN